MDLIPLCTGIMGEGSGSSYQKVRFLGLTLMESQSDAQKWAFLAGSHWGFQYVTIRKPSRLERQLTVWVHFLVPASLLPSSRDRAPGEGVSPWGMGLAPRTLETRASPALSFRPKLRGLTSPHPGAALLSSQIRLRSRLGPGGHQAREAGGVGQGTGGSGKEGRRDPRERLEVKELRKPKAVGQVGREWEAR